MRDKNSVFIIALTIIILFGILIIKMGHSLESAIQEEMHFMERKQVAHHQFLNEQLAHHKLLK
jgi:hypothetical protein